MNKYEIVGIYHGEKVKVIVESISLYQAQLIVSGTFNSELLIDYENCFRLLEVANL